MSSGLSFEYILRRDSRPAWCFRAREPGKGYVNDGSNPETRTEYEKQLMVEREEQLSNMTMAPGYAEPGYADTEVKAVLMANWNCFSRYAVDALENAGYAVEWSDEWTTCIECYKAIRTKGDSYEWQPYHVFIEGEGEVCLDCLNWQDYLESIEDNPDTAVMRQCNPADYGYRPVSKPEEYEAGMHPGQDDNPREILKQYQKQGLNRLVFRIPETSQFYIRFEVWQYAGEEEEESID